MLTPHPPAEPHRDRLAVWGDPIEHSLSPRLHAAAYGVLGLEWTYGRRRVGEDDFAGALAELGPEWRGLSLTMPLKHVAAARATALDERARLTGAVNTLLLAADGPHGFNTDVGGLVRALADLGFPQVPSARILGAGATATSALVALAELGARRVEIAARRPDAAAPLVALGESLGVVVVPGPLHDDGLAPVPVTISTLPGGVDLGDDVAGPLAAAGGSLVDVVYGTWPTPLALAWERAGGAAVSGRGMLLHQALLQVRVFVSGDPREPVAAETDVLAAMRAAVVGD